MERFRDKETELDVAIIPEASAYLKRLVLQPNPNLAEFAFLGLGQENLVDQILVVDEKNLFNKHELIHRGNMLISRIETDELKLLFMKLESIKRTQDLLVFGHLHPSGKKRIDGTLYSSINPSKILLPSMGDRKDGGPASSGDIGSFAEFVRKIPINFPYVGIAAITLTGPKLRIYDMYKLIKIKKYNDINKVPQTTIRL